MEAAVLDDATGALECVDDVEGVHRVLRTAARVLRFIGMAMKSAGIPRAASSASMRSK